MPRFVSMNLYERYRDAVWDLANVRQRYEPGRKHRGLTDEEIAAKLGLTAEDAAEIRCIAEIEKTPLEAYLDAEGIKEERFKRLPGKK